MTEIMACRVCLGTDVKLYDMFIYKLFEAYEKLLSAQLSSPDRLPHHLCSFCATLLLKATAFQQKAFFAQQLLLNAAHQNSLTTGYIKSVDRNSYNLALPYETKHSFHSIKGESNDSFLPLTIEVSQPKSLAKVLKEEENSDDEPLTSIVAEKKKKRERGQKKDKKISKNKNVGVKAERSTEDTTNNLDAQFEDNNILKNKKFEIKAESSQIENISDDFEVPFEDYIEQPIDDIPNSPDLSHDEDDVKPMIEGPMKDENDEFVDEFDVVELCKVEQIAESEDPETARHPETAKHPETAEHPETAKAPGNPKQCQQEGATRRKKAKPQNKVWKHVTTFKNKKDAEDYIRRENTWSYLMMNATKDGTKKYYRCNKVPRKGPQCSAQLYILLNPSTEEVVMCRTELDHDHETKKLTRRYKLSEMFRNEIERLLTLGLKQTAMARELAKIYGADAPRKSQILTYLVRRKRILRAKGETDPFAS